MATSTKPLRLQDMELEFSIGSAISTASSATRSVNRSHYERSFGSRLSAADALSVDDGGSATDRELSVTVIGPGTKIEEKPVGNFAVALMIAVLSHAIAGMPSGAFRFVYTRTGVGPLFVGMITTGPPLPFIAAYVSWKYGWRQLKRMPYTKTLTTIFAAWMPLALLAANYTLSVYVQLGSLSVPFLVVALEKILLKQQVPRFTVAAIVASTVGSAIAIFGDTFVHGASGLSLGMNDALGLGLAFLSFVCIALCVVTIRRIGARTECNTPDIVVAFWVNFGCVIGALATFYVDFEDWGSIWSNMAFADYAMLVCICVFYQVGTPFLDSLCIPTIGGSLYAAMLPFRMVFAIIGGYLLLGESFAPVNLAGTGLAVVVTFAYVYRQYRDHRKRSLRLALEDEENSISSSKANGDYALMDITVDELETEVFELGVVTAQDDEDVASPLAKKENEDHEDPEVKVIAEDASKDEGDIKEDPIV